MSTRVTFIPVILLATALSSTAAEQKSEPLNLVCITATRPVLVRLDVAVDGKPLVVEWESFARALFTHLDANNNGTLEGAELARLPPTLTLLTVRTGFPLPAAPALTRDGLMEYLRANDLGPLRALISGGVAPVFRRPVRGNAVGAGQALDKALFEALDSNADGKLSPDELTAGPAALGKLDTDENELISAAEVRGWLGRTDPPVTLSHEPGASSFPRFGLRVASRKSDPVLAKQLLSWYQPKRKDDVPARRLTKADLNLTAEAFAALDRDGDDELDPEELARFGGGCPPAADLALQLGQVPPDKSPAAVLSVGKADLTVTMGNQGANVSLAGPGIRIDFVPTSAGADPRGLYVNTFRQFDRDANGYLDAAEIRRSDLFRDLLPLIDADGDGKVFEKELLAALDKIQPLATLAARGLVAANVTEAGHGLFGIIDADGNGQLSQRELRQLPKLTKHFATAKNGSFRLADVPQHLRVTLASHPAGPWLIEAPIDRPREPRSAVGPTWFQKMDRNRDGDVSRREFLGSEDDFRRLDRDGDGLIDAHEAEAASKPETR
ncbi:transaldolase/EF-hand domain-containing protein [Gemmata obscuriglobus]|uniref:EF-hand domain-containing protein n=1 Tax=Gemmata obscuriglobus TaxID=114 RepID=A0A2Z3GWV6_9BACT|nr:calmodulin [Gemmata obscuriglobus]AWM38223.1 hypothetical protein C1280_15330 [Gemmata obscuriglobus]QEG28874.1 transaldolase/EF-hand domain-containing protein [Gemmata obscuriglobus]VTS07319.1 probable calmodulin : Uncharacterized protein OS=Singulisphaera acidiphila (strain ATCC BAA-1392 / DSM 18658 / VKM B-2454 / MOB10) GN=Sinac_3969 PE=4 SV=1: EF-hand_5: EF-hand_6: EF-hand_6: EF-hand_6: EF-hand_5: EF-hand_5 [Gemmata obscuriglobus UQM 2246]